MAGASQIDDYVTVLGRCLRGPGRVKRDLLAEARDSLADCAEAYQAEGLERAAAERRAVAEFGPVAEIAAGYQEELAASAGRRLALLVFATVPVTALVWALMWRIFPEAPGHEWAAAPGWFLVVAEVIDWSQLAMGVLGALALAGFGRWSRRLRRPRLLTRVFGAVVAADVVAVSLMSGALMIGGARTLDEFLAFPPGFAVSVLSFMVSLWQLRCALGCLAVTRPVAVPA